MNHKRKHRRHHSSCALCKPHKKGWMDRRTWQEIKADIAHPDFERRKYA